MTTSERARSIGLDVGGTNIKGVVLDAAGSVVVERRVPTPTAGPRELYDGIAALATELAGAEGADDGGGLPSIGVALAGFLDAERTRVRYSPNLPLRDSPAKEELAARLGTPVVLENDADAAGFAELRLGAGRGLKHAILLTLGTGVGSAVFVAGELVHGAFGIGGELGHVCLIPDGRPCHCGRRGCMEQYASGTALLRAAGELADGGGAGAALAEARGSSAEVPAEAISELAGGGDPGALAAIGEVAVRLGQACASVAAVLDPECFILGGGVAEGLGELIREPASRAFAAALPAAGHRPVAEFRLAELGNLAGAVGVAEEARTHEGRTE